ncbi:hypothetical protein I553_0778 [Mycobacterium xenopi 4042]|uniref:Uncharacterized protein n=1 Tax=Mycobacterium xenopi 4042 TaxID=1299334 RepID=X7YJ20_MYCXE|nr:hypothetical protein I553_0778 [Mycobacterium xenopi 4042]
MFCSWLDVEPQVRPRQPLADGRTNSPVVQRLLVLWTIFFGAAS